MLGARTLGILILILFPSYSIIQRIAIAAGAWLGLSSGFILFSFCGLILFYSVVVGLMLIFARRYLFSNLGMRYSSNTSIIFILFFVFVLIVLFMLIYPVATSGYFGGGSDRDEALNMAVSSLLKGEYPYYQLTYVQGRPHELGLDGHKITPLPGELIISLLFFLLFGNAAYQLFFWLLITIFLISKLLDSAQQSVFIVVAGYLLLPVMLHESLTGGDLLCNSLWILDGVLMLYLSKSQKALVGASVFLGFALSSRINFLLITPLITGLCFQKVGLKKTVLSGVTLATSFLLITLPFYFYDPTNFSPSHTYNKLGIFDELIPHIGLIVPLASGLFSILFMFKFQGHPLMDWLYAMTVILALPILAATLLQSIVRERLDFIEYAWYGLSWLYFALLAFFIRDEGHYLPSGSP